jgi:hypothetical protein
MGIVSDAISIADEAVKQAEQQPKQTEEIQLVKVASARCAQTADAVIKAGAFAESDRPALMQALQVTDIRGHRLLEMMASRSVFPVGSEDLRGTLVEKSAKQGLTTIGNSDSTNIDRDTLWQAAWAEAEDRYGSDPI